MGTVPTDQKPGFLKLRKEAEALGLRAEREGRVICILNDVTDAHYLAFSLKIAKRNFSLLL